MRRGIGNVSALVDSISAPSLLSGAEAGDLAVCFEGNSTASAAIAPTQKPLF
jgi:hypothetical protein